MQYSVTNTNKQKICVYVTCSIPWQIQTNKQICVYAEVSIKFQAMKFYKWVVDIFSDISETLKLLTTFLFHLHFLTLTSETLKKTSK
jgi:hypothetical protein